MGASKSSDNLYKQLIDNLYDGVYFVDDERRITYWNKGAERITGYLSELMVGSYCHHNLLNHVTEDGKLLCEEGCPLLATLHDGQLREAEVHLRHADGYRVPVLIRISPILDERRHIVGAVEVFSNNQSLFIMRRKISELAQKALFDTLTGLTNRAYTEARGRSALAEFEQHGFPIGLLMIDADNFKSVNDAYGHAAGDRVLQTIASNLSLHTRDTDVCGRWGGEEFVVILFNMDEKRLARVAEKLRSMIANSVTKVGDKELIVTVSIGAALAHKDESFDELLARADQLLYQSKQNGKNRVTI